MLQEEKPKEQVRFPRVGHGIGADLVTQKASEVLNRELAKRFALPRFKTKEERDKFVSNVLISDPLDLVQRAQKEARGQAAVKAFQEQFSGFRRSLLRQVRPDFWTEGMIQKLDEDIQKLNPSNVVVQASLDLRDFAGKVNAFGEIGTSPELEQLQRIADTLGRGGSFDDLSDEDKDRLLHLDPTLNAQFIEQAALAGEDVAASVLGRVSPTEKAFMGEKGMIDLVATALQERYPNVSPDAIVRDATAAVRKSRLTGGDIPVQSPEEISRELERNFRNFLSQAENDQDAAVIREEFGPIIRQLEEDLTRLQETRPELLTPVNILLAFLGGLTGRADMVLQILLQPVELWERKASEAKLLLLRAKEAKAQAVVESRRTTQQLALERMKIDLEEKRILRAIEGARSEAELRAISERVRREAGQIKAGRELTETTLAALDSQIKVLSSLRDTFVNLGNQDQAKVIMNQIVELANQKQAILNSILPQNR